MLAPIQLTQERITGECMQHWQVLYLIVAYPGGITIETPDRNWGHVGALEILGLIAIGLDFTFLTIRCRMSVT